MQTSHNRLLSWTVDPIGGELEYSESIDWTDVGTIPFLQLWGRKSEGDAFTTLAPANGSTRIPQLSDQSNAEAVFGLPAQTRNEHQLAWEPPYSMNDDREGVLGSLRHTEAGSRDGRARSRTRIRRTAS